MTTTPENNTSATTKPKRPMLQINRVNHVRINAKILDSTSQKLNEYLHFATEKMDTEITNDDVIEYALNLLFERDSAFKGWSKTRTLSAPDLSGKR